MKRLRVGTRGSPLALWQARAFTAAVERTGGPACELCVIRTAGDRLQQRPLAQVGGKRLFVKEIEDALLRGTVDVAVHSAKDMPAVLPDGLVIGAILPRGDPHDVLVRPASAGGPTPTAIEGMIEGLGPAPRIGTGSVRRLAQLKRLMPHARFDAIRGNLQTRLRMLDGCSHDGLVLAAAGLSRLGLGHRVSAVLPVQICVPAPGQGAVAAELRACDTTVRAIVARTSHAVSMAALIAERALVAALGGGCQVPIGAIATATGGGLDLDAVVVSLDGAQALRCRGSGPLTDPASLGRRLAEQLLADGAERILDDARRSNASMHESS